MYSSFLGRPPQLFERQIRAKQSIKRLTRTKTFPHFPQSFVHAKESALLAVYKYLCGQKLRVEATEKIWGELGGFCCFGGFFVVWCFIVVGVFLNLPIVDLRNVWKNNLCMRFLCLNKTYQNLILYIPDHINQFYRCKNPQICSVQVSHCVQRNTCPPTRCTFDTFTLLNVLNLSLINKNMRMHTQLTKNMEYWHCSLALPGGCGATDSSLSFKSGCWIHAEQSRKCTWTLPPGTDSKGQTETGIRRAKTIYHEQVPHHLVVTFCYTCHQN